MPGMKLCIHSDHDISLKRACIIKQLDYNWMDGESKLCVNGQNSNQYMDQRPDVEHLCVVAYDNIAACAYLTFTLFKRMHQLQWDLYYIQQTQGVHRHITKNSYNHANNTTHDSHQLSDLMTQWMTNNL